MPFIGNQPAEVALTTGDLGDDIVTEAKIANDAIGLTELKAGTDGELITWDASGNPAAVAVGTSTHVLTSNGAGAAPTFQAAGGLLQTIKVDVPAASGTTTIPADDTAPTISEGTQIGTQAITLASTSSKVIIQGSFQINMTASYDYEHVIALFRGSTCIGVTVGKINPSAGRFKCISFSILDAPATAGSVTYSIRAGATSSNAWLINGSGGNDYGGLLEDQVYIMEVGV